MKNAINYDFGSLSIQTFFDSVTLTAKSRIRWDDVVMDELTYAARSADDANILLRGELKIDIGQWAFIIINYDELKQAYE